MIRLSLTCPTCGEASDNFTYGVESDAPTRHYLLELDPLQWDGMSGDALAAAVRSKVEPMRARMAGRSMGWDALVVGDAEALALAAVEHPSRVLRVSAS